MLSFEEQLRLQEMQQDFLYKISALVLTIIILLSSGCLWFFQRKMNGVQKHLVEAKLQLSDRADKVEGKLVEAYANVEGKLAGAYKEAKDEVKNIKTELVEAKMALAQEINKPVSERVKEFYHEVVQTPEMVLLLIGACGLVVREYMLRRKHNDKEALEEFKTSRLLRVIDGVLAFLIIPALFKNGINAAVMAWKQASTFVTSMRTMVGGYNTLKSYFGTEVEMTVIGKDEVEDVSSAVDAVISRVEVGVKQAIKHHNYLKHDKSKDFFRNVHFCNDNCEYRLYAHASTCHLSELEIDELDVLYDCPCQMGSTTFTIDTYQVKNGVEKKAVMMLNGKTHYDCAYIQEIKNYLDEEFKHNSVLKAGESSWLVPTILNYECDCAATKANTMSRYNSVVRKQFNFTGPVSPQLEKVLNHQNQTLQGTIQSLNAEKNKLEGYETDSDEDLDQSQLSWFKKTVRGDKKMVRLLAFMKNNEQFLVGGCVLLLATLFMIMMYNEKTERKASTPIVEPVKKKIKFIIPKVYKHSELEGKVSDEKRAAARAAKNRVATRAVPYWDYADERMSQDSDFDIHYGDEDNGENDDWAISAEEQEQINAEEQLLNDALKGYDHEASSVDFEKEAYVEMRIRNVCPRGAKCKFQFKKCSYNHDVSKKTKRDCHLGVQCKYQDKICDMDHKLTKMGIIDDLRRAHERKNKLKTVKSHTKGMDKFVPKLYEKKYEAMVKSIKDRMLVKEGMYNGNNLCVTADMINCVGWCETDGNQAHNATAIWSGFIISNHVFGEKGEKAFMSFHVNNVIERGTWEKKSGKWITEDTIYFEWYKCLDNEVLRKRSGGCLKSSFVKQDDKLMQLVYKTYDDFVAKKIIMEPSKALSITQLYNSKNVPYIRVAVKNSTDYGYCASPYINTSGCCVGVHNEKGDDINYFIGIDREVTVRATGSSLNL